MSRKKHEKQEEAAAPSQGMITLLGGEEIEVTHLPAGAFDEASLKRAEKFQSLLGKSEFVLVRQVLVSQMPRYGQAIVYGDEASAIEIYCGKEPGWADTLCPASVNAVADKGLELNLPFFSAWFQRQAKWKETQLPKVVTDFQTKLTELEKKFTDSLSPNSSSKTSDTTV